MSDFYREPQSSDSFQENNGYNAPFNPHLVVPPTSGKSIASMVLGILNLLLIFMPYFSVILGILAIILSAISFKEIRRYGEAGKGMAVAGLVCGIVGTIFGLIILAIMIIAIVAESSSNPFSDI